MRLLRCDLKINKTLNKIISVFAPGAQLSYSQFAEDIILKYFFAQLGIMYPTYHDIGANDPRNGSNTYKFYRKGSKGVLLEPNPDLAHLLKKVRPRDTSFNLGVGVDNTLTQSNYYQFPSWAGGLNNFSKENAEYWETTGHSDYGRIQVERVITINLISVNHILRYYFPDYSPNFISLDVEGLDLQVLQSFDFDHCKSEVICGETMGYDDDKKTFERKDIISFLQSKSYMNFADTRVNTIFCKSDLIKS